MEPREAAFSELLSAVVDNRGRSCPTVDSGIPLIATNCIRNESLYPTREDVRYVSRSTYATWFRGHLMPGDIIFVNKGTPGRVCLVPDPVDFCIAQDMVAVRADNDLVYPKFLFAVLRSPEVQECIQQMHVGTMIPHFKKADFTRLLLPVPKSRSIQEFIGDLYFAFSAKIDLNQQKNMTLQSVARSLFRSWFVDFDPVVAKAAGRAPLGMDAATAALFPSSFEDSELGPIPRGWRVTPLDQIAEFLNGLPLQRYPADRGTTLPVIKIAQLRAGSAAGAERASLSVPSEYVIDDGDLIFSWSGSLLVELWCGGRAALNQHLFKVSPRRFPKWFCFHWLRLHLPEFQGIAADKATTMGHIRRHHLTEALVVTPPDQLLGYMDARMKPLLDLRVQNTVASRTVAALRDTLLPKLLSGEIRLRDAERAVEAVV